MPAKSEAQYRLMQAAKHNPSVRKSTGISRKVAEEFTKVRPTNLPEHKTKAGALRNHRNKAMTRY